MIRLIGPMIAATLLAAQSSIASAASAPHCRAGEVPAFHLGFAQLKALLRDGMGDPIECEHITGTTGQLTVQDTTAGIAYYLADVNLAAFVVLWNGKPHDNFGIVKNGLIYWQGDAGYPPHDAPVVSSDFCDTSADASPPGDPVRRACAALYITQLGDPFAGLQTPRPPATLSPRPVSPAIPPAVAPSVPPPSGAVVDDYIDGEFRGWSGDTVFRLQNGQVWQQVEYDYNYTYDYSPRVLIYPYGGGWRMQVEGMTDSIAVRRLR